MSGFFLSWTRPSPEQQKSIIGRSKNCFNYDPKYNCATSPSEEEEEEWKKDKQLRNAGFHINDARVLLGSGDRTFRMAKSALQSWKHFELDWACVEPNTSVEKGTNFCVCARILRGFPWVAMPLQIVFVNDTAFGSNNEKGRFDFGSGTLCGHLLAGEERFSIQWDKDDRVCPCMAYREFVETEHIHYTNVCKCTPKKIWSLHQDGTTATRSPPLLAPSIHIFCGFV